MPRALTEQEKMAQYQKLLDKGKDAVLLYGVRKVSVDDIAKAAGFAKGTFYQHFESKHEYLHVMIEQLTFEVFDHAEKLLINAGKDAAIIEASAREILRSVFMMPEFVFLVQNEQDMNVLFDGLPNKGLHAIKLLEEDLFEKLLQSLGVNTEKVKPGVVHNIVHIMILMSSNELLIEADLPETINLLMDSMFSYIISNGV